MDFQGRPFYLLGGGSGGGGGTGDVTGPNSSTVDAIPRFSTNSGKSIKDSLVTISDTGRVEGVSVLETEYIQSGGSFLHLQGEAEVLLSVPISSSLAVNTDIVVDTDGTVSLTGRAAPTAIAINGATVLSGSLSLTGQILMNGASQIKGVALPSLPQDVATKEYVDNLDAVKWAQLLYNSPTNVPLTVSGQLSTINYNRLLPIVNIVPANYYISSFNINIVDNVGFVLLTLGTYKIRYRVGIRSDVATPQTASVVLRIDNIIRLDSEQYVSVSNSSITYHDFEYIFTNTVQNAEVFLFAKISTLDTTLETSYLCFNIIEI